MLPVSSRTAAIIRREYMQRVTNTWFLVATFGVPVGLFLILLVPSLLLQQEPQGDAFQVAVIDHSGRVAATTEPGSSGSVVSPGADTTGRPQRLGPSHAGNIAERAALGQEGRISVTVLPGGRHIAPTAFADSLRMSRYDAFLVLPDSVLRAGTVDVYSIGNVSPETQSDLRRWVRRATLEQVLSEEGLSVTAADRLLRASDLTLSVSRVSEGGTRSQQIIQGMAFGAGVLLYLLLLVYGQMIVRSVMREKDSDIVEILLSSVRPSELMTGKILGVAGVGLTQTLIWGLIAGGVAVYLLSAPASQQLLTPVQQETLRNLPFLALAASFLTYFLLGYFLYASIFAAMGALVGPQSETQQVSLPVMLLIVAAFVLLVPVMNAPGAGWAQVVSQIPFFSPILMLARVTAGTAGTMEVALSLALLVVAVVITTWLSGRIYRLGILMQGKRPSPSELLRWMRYG